MLISPAPAAEAEADPYLWLEDVHGERALEFVERENARTRALLEAQPEFASLQRELREVLDSRERIPFVTQRGAWLYNFWQDADHPRGLWRRTTWAEYRKPEPAWDVMLDLDALAKAEGENWVWKGAVCLPPEYERCVLRLSRGGGDAVVIREFDPVAKAFVTPGFHLPEAKSQFIWRDRDTAYVGSDFGPGSMTTSGYPRTVKRWTRGTAIEGAPVVFEGRPDDVSVDAWVEHSPGHFREGFDRAVSFYESEMFVLRDGRPVRLDLPLDAEAGIDRDRLFVQLRSDWTIGDTRYPTGALLVAGLDPVLDGQRRFDVLFEPTDRVSLAGYSPTKSAVLINVLDHVRGRVIEATHGSDGWRKRDVALPGDGQASAGAVDPDVSDEYWLVYEDPLTPDTLFLGRIGRDDREALKALPAFFDTNGMRSVQYEAVSRDGTRVPYFVVGAEMALRDGRAPTLLYGYGGFEHPLVPWYSGTYGRAWFARGGVFVLANIRGGGEFGPGWHQAAVKQHRQNAFDDFAAVAEDLAARGLTTPEHLGIMGGSNGGLLVGAVMLQRPELFRAVVCQVPLLDMRRYHRLLAGASWMAEYGDPDVPEEWAYLSKYSPYQNVRTGADYPSVLFTTSTRDDRVHPGHARKMFARMQAQGHDVLYYENTEGGHAGAANNEQRARMLALEFAYLWRMLR